VPLLLLLDGSGVEEQTRYITDTIVSQPDLLRLLDSVRPQPDTVAGGDPARGIAASISPADTVKVSDPKTISVSVPKTDQVGIPDPKTLTASNSGRDTLSLLDLRGAGVGRVDTASVSDSRSIRPSIWKTDTGAFSDLRGAGVGRTDGVAASEQKSLQVGNSRQDTAAVSDPRGAGVGLKADTVSLLDLKALKPSIAKTDAVAVSDPRGAGIGLKADGLALSDLRNVNTGVSKTDTGSFSDLRGAGVGRVDTVSESDLRQLTGSLLKADTASVSDSRGAGVGLKADTVSGSDSKSLRVNTAKVDTAAASDPRGAGIGLKADTVSAADSKSLRVDTSKVDLVPIADPRGAGVGLKADTVSSSDQKLVGANTSKTDTTAADDRRLIRVSDTVRDVVVSMDAITAGVLVTNILSALDKMNLAVSLSLLDTVVVGDAWTIDSGVPVQSRLITDTIASGGSLGVGAGIANTIAALDQRFISSLVQVINQTILSDSRLVLLGLSKSDTVSVSEVKIQALTDAHQDGLVLADVRQILGSIVKSDDVKVGDAVSALQAWQKQITDTVKASQTFSAGVGLANVLSAADLRAILSSVSKTDTVSAGEVKSINPGLSHSDIAAAGQQLGAGVGLTNTFKVADVVAKVQAWVISILDNVKVDDATKQALAIALRDSVLVSETLTTAMGGGNSGYSIDTTKLLDTLSILVSAALRDTINGADKLYPGIGVANTLVAREGAKSIGTGLQDQLTLRNPLLTDVSQRTAEGVSAADVRALQPRYTLLDSVTSSERLRQSLQAALADMVSINDQKALNLAVAKLADQLLAGDKRSVGVEPRIADSVRASDRVAQAVLANISDGVVITKAALGLALAVADTLTLSELHRAAAGILHADASVLSDPKTLSIFRIITDTAPVIDQTAGVRGLQLMLQDMLLSSDRLSASVSTLIQAALGVLDEATNDGIPGPPVLFLRFTEEVLRTHGFTGQALRLQKFTDEVLRTHGFTKQSLKR
jgi:hypothetical protein